MPTAHGETFYDLATRALESQDRQVGSLRARTGTLVAAAAVGATLLVPEAFSGTRPSGAPAWAATLVGLGGLLAVLLASTYVLRSHDLAFSLDAAATFEEAQHLGAFEDDDPEGLHIGLTYTLSVMHADNARTVNRLKGAFAWALAGLVVGMFGLGMAAALA